MSRPLRIACTFGFIAVICMPALVHAAGDINIAWNDCVLGAGSAANLAFACNVSTGAEQLYVSFRPPAPRSDFKGAFGTMLVTIDDVTAPPWWHVETGGCRAGRIVSRADFTGGPFSCVDFWQGQAVGSGVIDVGYGSPNVLRIRSVFAVVDALAGPIDPAFEYYAYAIAIQNTKTTGTGSCAGCLTPACFALSQVELDYADGSSEIITDGAQRFITWQGGGSLPCPGATPARNPTWGQIKSLYR